MEDDHSVYKPLTKIEEQQLYDEAIASLDRIGTVNELPGDRRVVRNVLTVFAALSVVQSLPRGPREQIEKAGV